MKRFLIIFLFFGKLYSQDQGEFKNLTLEKCIELALKRNLSLEIAKLEEAQGNLLVNAALEIPKTSFLYTQGQINSIYRFDNNYSVSQSIPFPGTNVINRNIAKLNSQKLSYKRELTERDVKYQVKRAFHTLSHHLKVKHLLIVEDSVYTKFLAIEKEKFAQGKSSVLEYTIVSNKKIEIENSLIENEEMIVEGKTELEKLLNIESEITINTTDYKDKIQEEIDSTFIDYHPLYKFYKTQKNIDGYMIKQNRFQMLPELVLGYSNLSIYGPANIGNGEYFLTKNNRLSTISFGINLPLWLRPYKQKAKTLELQRTIEDKQLELTKLELDLNWKRSMQTYKFYLESILKTDKASSTDYTQIISSAIQSFEKSEINYIDYLTVVSTAINTEQHHLFAEYHKILAKVQMDYLIGK